MKFKSRWNEFVLKVHPDYFNSNQKAKEANQRALQTMNSIMSELKTGSTVKRSDWPLEVYWRSKSGLECIHHGLSTHRTALRSFRKPSSLILSYSFHELFSKTGMDCRKDMELMESQMDKPRKHSTNERFQELYRNNPMLHSEQLDFNQLSNRYPFVFHHASLNLAKRIRALTCLHKHRLMLQYHSRWKHRIIMFVENNCQCFTVDSRGILYVPYDFKPIDLLHCFETNFPFQNFKI